MSEIPPGDTPQETPRSGFTLDLSSGVAGKPKRPKGFVPVVQKTINLTTKKAEPVAETPESARPAPAQAPHPDGRRGGPRQDAAHRNEPRRPDPRRSDPPSQDARRRDDPRPSGGTSLADLLDEATLARLRGE